MINCCLALASLFVAQDVIVVEPNGLGDATTIQAAVDLAADGDTILVRRSPRPDVECCYPPFVIDGKSVAIHGTGPGLHYTGAVTIRNIPLGASVTLSGLDIYWPHASTQDPLTAPGLTIQDCQGAVRVQNLRSSGFEVETYFGLSPSPAIYIDSCADVVLRDCVLVGTAGEVGYGGAGSPGVRAIQSDLAIYGCDISGGLGGSDVYLQSGVGSAGGDGLNLSGGTLFARGSSFLGGKGGLGMQAADAADGGAGLRLESGASAAVVDCVLQGGAGGGLFGAPSSEVGTPGPDSSGDVTVIALPHVSFDAPTTVFDESTVRARFEGQSGDMALLLVAPSTRSSDRGIPAGILHAQPLPNGRMPQGPIPASGVLEVDFTLAPVPAGDSRRHYLQGAFENPDGTVLLADLVVMDVLGEGFDENCGSRIHVDADAPDGGDGKSWASAYNDLGFALLVTPDCSDDPAEVWVADGIYTAAADSFFVQSSTRLYGGFRGHETSLSQRDLSASETVLDGAGTLFTTLQIGSPSFFQDSQPEDFVEGAVSGVIVDGVVVRGARFFGVAVVGQAQFRNCRFEDNLSRGVGSAGGDLQFIQCSFSRNGLHGLQLSAVEVLPGDVLIAQSVFVCNQGGALAVNGRSGPLDVDIASCTIAGNAGTGGLRFEYDQHPNSLRVRNSILWGNTGGMGAQDSQIALVPSGGMSTLDVEIDHACVEGWDGSLGGAGNIGSDPGIDIQSGTAGLVLPLRSACVDAGSNAALPADLADLDGDGDLSELLPVDFRGHIRVQDVVLLPGQPHDPTAVVDMGAFEASPLRPRGARPR